MVYSTDLTTVLLAIAMIRLHKILNRVHNGKQLSNIDMSTLALLLTGSILNTQLMRLAVFTVLAYGCATWVCRWVVAEAKRKDKLEEEEDALSDDIDADAGEDTNAPVNTPRSRSGSVVLHDDAGDETDPDMPPLIDADFDNVRPADEVDYKPAPITLEPYVAPDYNPSTHGWMPTVGAESGTVDMVARPARGTVWPPVAITETHEPAVMGLTVNEYVSEVSYQNARTDACMNAITEAEAAYKREGADVAGGATYPPAEEEKVFQALRDKYF